jgi:hypothetical protein
VSLDSLIDIGHRLSNISGSRDAGNFLAPASSGALLHCFGDGFDDDGNCIAAQRHLETKEWHGTSNPEKRKTRSTAQLSHLPQQEREKISPCELIRKGA